VAAASGRTLTFSGSGDAQRLKALFVPDSSWNSFRFSGANFGC